MNETTPLASESDDAKQQAAVQRLGQLYKAHSQSFIAQLRGSQSREEARETLHNLMTDLLRRCRATAILFTEQYIRGSLKKREASVIRQRQREREQATLTAALLELTVPPPEASVIPAQFLEAALGALKEAHPLAYRVLWLVKVDELCMTQAGRQMRRDRHYVQRELGRALIFLTTKFEAEGQS